MVTLFWTAFLLVVTTYVGYPMLMALLAQRRPLMQPDPPTEWPAVSVIVPFCNEPERVAAKLATLKGMNYPGVLQIIFVADGEGETADAVRSLDEVEKVVLTRRQGKPAALNAGLREARHDLVMFTDARQEIASDALRLLVARIQDPGIGAVSGELVQRDENDREQVGLYWKYELFIRKVESRYDSVPGVSGALYLMRRELCRPLPEDTLLDDVVMPLNALRGGRRIVLEIGARVYDRVAANTQQERRRKLRTLTGNFQLFRRDPWLLLPWKNKAWMQFAFHKAARLLVPYALMVLFVVPLLQHGVIWRLFWTAQAVFYLMAFGSGRNWPLCDNRLAATARLFTELNLTAALAAWKYMSAPVDPRWEKTS